LKPETNFHQSVNRALPNIIHIEKMMNPYRRGTPDFYYEGPNGHLWVEYKWLTKTHEKIYPRNLLSENQQIWLIRAHRNKVPTAVIIGCPDGAIMLRDKAWNVAELVPKWEHKRELNAHLKEILIGNYEIPKPKFMTDDRFVVPA
jgi:hypothetical protein